MTDELRVAYDMIKKEKDERGAKFVEEFKELCKKYLVTVESLKYKVEDLNSTIEDDVVE